jgi:hypothetical protein
MFWSLRGSKLKSREDRYIIYLFLSSEIPPRLELLSFYGEINQSLEMCGKRIKDFRTQRSHRHTMDPSATEGNYSHPPAPPPALPSSELILTSPVISSSVKTFSLKCLRCSCHGHLTISSSSTNNSSTALIIQSNCSCLCCHHSDSNCVYCAIDQCIECHQKYLLQFDEKEQNYYFSCFNHCHHQKYAFSYNFNSLSRHRINRRIPPSYKTLLHSSILAGDPDLTWDLLQKGANPFICDASGITAIDLAKILRQGKIQTSLNEKKIFEILPKISFPDSKGLLSLQDTRLRTQSDCGPEIPNSFHLSPKKPKMKKQPLPTDSLLNFKDTSAGPSSADAQKSRKKKTKTVELSVTPGNFSPQDGHHGPSSSSLFDPSSELSPYAPPPFISPKVIKKKRSMTMSSSQQFPPETPRVHIHNNTFSKATSQLLTKKERAMTFSSPSLLLSLTLPDEDIAHVPPPPSSAPLSYGKTRRESSNND